MTLPHKALRRGRANVGGIDLGLPYDAKLVIGHTADMVSLQAADGGGAGGAGE
jgi:hypothetical protein